MVHSRNIKKSIAKYLCDSDIFELTFSYKTPSIETEFSFSH